MWTKSNYFILINLTIWLNMNTSLNKSTAASFVVLCFFIITHHISFVISCFFIITHHISFAILCFFIITHHISLPFKLIGCFLYPFKWYVFCSQLITFFSVYFDSTIRVTTFLPSFCHFTSQISYPFDFINWHNLLVEFYGNGRPVDAIYCQA